MAPRRGRPGYLRAYWGALLIMEKYVQNGMSQNAAAERVAREFSRQLPSNSRDARVRLLKKYHSQRCLSSAYPTQEQAAALQQALRRVVAPLDFRGFAEIAARIESSFAPIRLAAVELAARLKGHKPPSN